MTKLRHVLTCGAFAVVLAAAAAPAQTASTGFFGGPWRLPGIGYECPRCAVIDAVFFDNGGEGIAYHDTSPGNSGVWVRPGPDTDVDTWGPTDLSHPEDFWFITDTRAGEWLNYTVSVPTDGFYTMSFRVFSAGAGGTFHLEANGIDVTGPLAIPDTGSWAHISRASVRLAAGPQVFRLVMDSVGSSGQVGYFNRMVVQQEPFPLPGIVQAEYFDNGGEGNAYHDTSAGNSGGVGRASDVDLEATSDAGGGYNIGWVSAGEWLKYTVTVASAGLYTLDVRVASPGIGGTFHLEAKGIDVTGPLAVPDTGDWQSWVTVSQPSVPLAAGTQELRLVMDSVGESGAVGNFNWVSATSEGGESTPYGGTAAALPGLVQAEHFDNGGEGHAYHDASSGNSGGAYRATDVDLEGTSDAGGGYNIGWVSAGEWLNYSVQVATAGLYTIQIRVASPGVGGMCHLEVNGIDVTGAIPIPDTGGWQSWVTVSRSSVPLAAGTQVFRLVMDSVGSSGAVGNINWISATLELGGGSTPYGGTAATLPGLVQAEHFDDGGEGVAYHDASAGNSGGAFRATNVDLEGTSDAGDGYNIGWVSAGEWLNYSVNVVTAGLYTVQLRVASPGLGGTCHLEVNGIDVTGALAIPDTGGWQSWATVSRASVPLAAGPQVLRLVMDSIGSSGAVGNFNWIRVEPEQTSSPFRITAPAPGATLRTTAVSFRWEGAGDEFWLKIGSAPGQADLYASASLGPATEHSVSHVPLSGRTLYVELIRRVGNVSDSVRVQYTAPVRKGLAIITDFADRGLEDWTGPGMKSVDDVSLQLRTMEDHWAFLSRGLETFRWDILRVQLPRPAVSGAYSWWGEFRDSVITLARQQIDTRDYDVDSDGIIDASWLIVSIGDASLEYVIGGMSRNAGANLFVDGQASGSVQAGATGNFNHELGHCLGLPDMYGTYGTMSALTVMSYSWPVPPPDFSAFERVKLGWLTPQVVSQTTQGVWLPSAHDTLAAVKVPTSRPSEYFLIEYRRRPSSGYGAVDNDFNGLAIYHVLEGSSMWQDPPILKLEPADGAILPSQPVDPHDFASPDNPAAIYPIVLYSYFGDHQEVFRVDNVSWRDDGLAFDVTFSGPQPSSNLLANGSFETGRNGLPDGWTTGAWVAMPDAFVWPSPEALTGASSAHLNASSDNDIRWNQVVSTLVPGENYLLCGWLKGEGIGGSGAVGANVSLLGGFVRSQGLLGTFDWTQNCVGFVADTPRVEVACRLGFYASTNSGNMWCDDVTLEHVRRAFPPGDGR
jgi:hypothetical protein